MSPRHLAHMRQSIVVIIAAIFLSAPFVGGVQPASALANAQDGGPGHKLKVVATFSILADWIENVGGDYVDVQTLVPAGGDAHSFDPSPDQVASLSEADLVFEIGAGFEPWLDDIYDSSGTDATRIVVSNGVELRTLSDPDAETTGDDGSEHEHGSTDPHIWGNVQNAITAVDNITAALTVADPDMKALYQSSATNYVEQLAELDAWVKTEVEKLLEGDRKLVTSHDALGYYTDAYGFTIVGTVLGTTTEEAEPSAQQIGKLIDQIEASGVKAIFAENVENPSVIEAIASEAGVKVGPVLYTDALGESGSEGDTYLKLTRYNTTSIVTALLGE